MYILIEICQQEQDDACNNYHFAEHQYLANVEVALCERPGIMCDKFLFDEQKLFELFIQHRTTQMNREGVANN